MNKQNVKRARNRILRIQKKLSQERDQVTNEYVKKLTKEFNRIKRDTVGKKYKGWYGEYEPMYYRRHYELYKVAQLQIDTETGKAKINFDAQRLTGFYRVTMNKYLGTEKGREYIYKLSFVDGFHGGARSGPPDRLGRPFPGNRNMPFYRTPPSGFFPLKYSLWGQAAIQTSSPKRTMEREFGKSLEKVSVEIFDALDKRLEEYAKESDRNVDIIIDEYMKNMEKK